MLDIMRLVAALPREEQMLFNHAQLDLASRQAYIAWLVERGDPRGEALEAEDAWRAAGTGPRSPELLGLIEAIDPLWWSLMNTSTRLNCGKATRARPKVRFGFRCPVAWSSLTPTDTAGARGCDGCGERVYWCDDVASATERARQGQCIAVPAALVADAAEPGGPMMLGRPDYAAMWADRIFRKPG